MKLAQLCRKSVA